MKVLSKNWQMEMVMSSSGFTDEQRLAALIELFVASLNGAAVSISEKNFVMMNATVSGRKIQLGGTAMTTQKGGKFAKLGPLSFGRKKPVPPAEETKPGKKPVVVKSNKKKEF